MAAAIPKKKDIPESVWMKCPGCSETVFRKLVEERLMVCPECNYHHRITSAARIDMLADAGTFEERHIDLTPGDPLEFTDRQPYPDRIKRYQKITGLKEAVVCGTCKIEGNAAVLCIMDSSFLMASMGSVVGEKITRCVEDALEMRLPLIIICASGGARMQEGVISLMQMAKTSAALAKLDDANGIYIPVLTDPTTAGVMAAFASLGDITIAEPKAMIGFTGPRVIKETIRAELPPGFQTSEFLLEHGFIDCIVSRMDLKAELVKIIEYCMPGAFKAKLPAQA
jgi:acetyl-CoA carboxylase carboxyl transferase subunit beta